MICQLKNKQMKTKFTKYLLVLLLAQCTYNLSAQDYNQAIKLKLLGSHWGVTYKYLTEFESGYEVMFQSGSQGFNVTGLRVYQMPAFPERSSKWFFCYGFGGHAAFYDNYEIYNPFTPFDPPIKYHNDFVSLGMDGYAGLEYRFLKHPFVLSIDFIPNFEFFGPGYFRVNANNLCFGVAYAF
jgi:hypothetical protein